MLLLRTIEELQALSPEAQTLFVACFFILILYLLTLVAFYPKAAQRIEKFIKACQLQPGNKRIHKRSEEGDK